MARQALRRWRDHPVAFCVEVLGLRMWSRLRDLLEAVRDHDRVAVKAGQKLSKSTGAVALALWWVVTRPNAQVMLTAPSGHQARNILWAELSRLYRLAESRGLPIGGALSPDPSTGLRFADGRRIFAVTTDDPNKLQGLSGRNQLVIVDEACGFAEPLWDPLLGNLSGGGKLLAISNPTVTSGRFYEMFTSRRSDRWKLLTISALESPNVRKGKLIIPGLATRESVAEKREDYGEDSPLYQIRVLGQFPSQSDNAVVPLALLEAGQARWAETPDEPSATLNLGVDVARFGTDDSCIKPVAGKLALPDITVHGFDTIQVAGAVKELLLDPEMRRPNGPARVKVDTIGYGAGVFDTLRSWNDDGLLGENVEIISVNVAERADDEDQYTNLRTQLWFGARQWLAEGGALDDDDRLAGDLVAPLYDFDARGRYRVEKKDQIKKRIGRSPDKGDAFCLAVYGGWDDGGGWLDDETLASVHGGGGRWGNVKGRGF